MPLSHCLCQRVSLRVFNGRLAVLPASPTRLQVWRYFSDSSAAVASTGIYVRSKGDRVHCKVYVPGDAHVDDLKQAAMAKLKLDISPTRVRLVHELDGGTTRDLDNCALLAEAGLAAGSRVLVEHVGELLWLAECSATHTSSYYCLLHTLTHAPLL